MTNEVIKKLSEAALDVRKKAYCPYSGFAVGAALLCADGRVFTGCNIENSSFGLTNCAERTALFKAVSEGRRRFTRIAIAATADRFTAPCGVCRQVLAEFDPELTMEVILVKTTGETLELSLIHI